jgi:hypothetical protein
MTCQFYSWDRICVNMFGGTPLDSSSLLTALRHLVHDRTLLRTSTLSQSVQGSSYFPVSSKFMQSLGSFSTQQALKRPYRSSGGLSPTSHHGGPSSSPGQVMWDLWWTERQWDRFSQSTSVPRPLIHSTNCSTIITTCHPGLVQ